MYEEPEKQLIIEELLKQNLRALDNYDQLGIVSTVETVYEDLRETGLWEGAKDLLTGSIIGLVMGAVEIGLGVPKFIELTSHRREPANEIYHDLFLKSSDLPKRGLTWLVNDGLYQGKNISEVISKSKSETKYSDTFRLLGIDLTFNFPDIIGDIARYTHLEIGERWGLGSLVPWYPKMHSRIFDGNIIFFNGGPLHPLTAWNLWHYHSKCSLDSLVGIFWTASTNLGSECFDNFAFPMLTDFDNGWYYSWIMVDSVLMDHETDVEVALGRKLKHVCEDFQDYMLDGSVLNVHAKQVAKGQFYYPVRQRVDSKCQTKERDLKEFKIHRHTVGKGNGVETVEHFCIDGVCLGDGTRADIPMANGLWNRGIGLTSQYHTNLLSTLVNCKPEAQLMNVRKLLLSGNSRLSLNNLQNYEAAYLKAAAHVKHTWVDSNVIVTKELVSNIKVSNTATDLYYAARKKQAGTKKSQKEKTKEFQQILLDYFSQQQYPNEWQPEAEKIEYGHRKSFSRIDSILTSYEIGSIDEEDMIDALWKIRNIIKAKIFIGGELSIDVVYSAKKSKGLALEQQEHHPKQCTLCRKFAPNKYKWVKGYCESCYYASRNNVYEDQVRVGDNLYYMPDNDNKIHYISYPTILKAAIPYYKPKPLRDNLKNNGKYDGVSPGWKLTNKPPKNKSSSPSQLVGVRINTRGIVLDLGNKEIEERTLQVRIFAKPISDAKVGKFEKLFEFAIKHNLLGPKQQETKPMPVINYDFGYNGALALDLMALGIANKNTLEAVLFKMKKNVDELNEKVWKITDWNSKSWISTFEPRKRSIYYRALLSYGKDKKKGSNLPKIDFSFFLKRELDTHGCDLSGRRPAMNPRIICNPSAISQIIAGPFLRPATGHLHKILNLDNCGTYFGGLKPEEGNIWARRIFDNNYKIRLQNRGIGEENLQFVIIENDFSKFDATYNSAAFKFVYSVYDHWGLPMNNELFRHVLESWKQPKGRFRSGTLVRAPIMNASGRADTALMNALINYFVQLSAYLEVEFDKDIMDVTPQEFSTFTKTFRIAVLGDDSLTITKYVEGMEQRVSDIIQDYGFEARDMKTHFDARKAVFLGNRLYPVVEEDIPTIAWAQQLEGECSKLELQRTFRMTPSIGSDRFLKPR